MDEQFVAAAVSRFLDELKAPITEYLTKELGEMVKETRAARGKLAAEHREVRGTLEVVPPVATGQQQQQVISTNEPAKLLQDVLMLNSAIILEWAKHHNDSDESKRLLFDSLVYNNQPLPEELFTSFGKKIQKKMTDQQTELRKKYQAALAQNRNSYPEVTFGILAGYTLFTPISNLNGHQLPWKWRGNVPDAPTKASATELRASLAEIEDNASQLNLALRMLVGMIMSLEPEAHASALESTKAVFNKHQESIEDLLKESKRLQSYALNARKRHRESMEAGGVSEAPLEETLAEIDGAGSPPAKKRAPRRGGKK